MRTFVTNLLYQREIEVVLNYNIDEKNKMDKTINVSLYMGNFVE